jgi:hypothetical protein
MASGWHPHWSDVTRDPAGNCSVAFRRPGVGAPGLRQALAGLGKCEERLAESNRRAEAGASWLTASVVCVTQRPEATPQVAPMARRRAVSPGMTVLAQELYPGRSQWLQVTVWSSPQSLCRTLLARSARGATCAPSEAGWPRPSQLVCRTPLGACAAAVAAEPSPPSLRCGRALFSYASTQVTLTGSPRQRCRRSGRRCPAVRQQFVDPAGRMRRQPLQHVLQVRVGLVPVDARRVQQAHDCRGALARARAAGEQPALSSQRNRPDVAPWPRTCGARRPAPAPSP